MSNGLTLVELMLYPPKPERVPLIKIVGKEYLGRTFNDLIQYLLDPSPDKNNRDKYTRQQMQHVTDIGDILEYASQENNSRLTLYGIGPNKQDTTYLDTTHVVGEYSDQLFKTKRIRDTNGNEIRCNSLELVLLNDIAGG